MNQAGELVTADLYLPRALPENGELLAACERALARSGMTVVSASYRAFSPEGLTAVWLLMESHLALHTYPEHRYLSVDCYTCGEEGRAQQAVAALVRELRPAQVRVNAYARGETLQEENGAA